MSVLLSILGNLRVSLESTSDGVEGDGDAVEGNMVNSRLRRLGEGDGGSLVLLEETHNTPNSDARSVFELSL